MLTDVHQLVVTFEALNGNKNMFVYSFMHSLLCLVLVFRLYQLEKLLILLI